jgi:translation initiation factor IF-1
MRIHLLSVALLGTLVAGCSEEAASPPRTTVSAGQPSGALAFTQGGAGVQAARMASMIDRGSLVEYERQTPALKRGDSTLYPVRLSEAHALRAIGTGGMVIGDPEGHPIRLDYVNHVDHGDGNWTWIGRLSGDNAGAEAVITFGDKAVFGTIPVKGGEPLQLTTAAARTWLVETSSSALDGSGSPPATQTDADFVVAGATHRAANTKHPVGTAAATPTVAQALVPTLNQSSSVDVVLGYTVGFANRLGGQSQAVTRLQFLVDLGNQAYVDSQVPGRIRMVRAIQVTYPDNTANQAALFDLSGLSCTTSDITKPRTPDSGETCTGKPVPPALLSLVAAKVKYGADLVSLVRNFVNPDNGSCGVGWLIGAGQTPITAADWKYGYSIVGDSDGATFPSNGQTCRQEYLVHELGHNMGLQHDRATAAGMDDTNGDTNLLDPEEFGRYPYSFGYNTDASSGNFYTIMALRQTGQTGYRVFSNPRISTCGGFACGVANQADNALALTTTMPVIASFGHPVNDLWFRGDFDGDGKSDLLWRNAIDGRDTIWKSANSATPQAVTTANNFDWVIAGVGDFDGDGKADILWRNMRDGRNSIWKSANSATPQTVTTINNLDWVVAGIADFDGDGKADILWRNNRDGRDTIWKSANSATSQAVTTANNFDWVIVGIGDFDGDGKADILWRNLRDGRNSIWKSANSATPQTVTTINNLDWAVAGVGDFDGDGKDDILWRNNRDGRDTIWKSANSATSQAVTTANAFDWVIGGIGDFDGDGKADMLWRNLRDGRNSIWRSANSATPQTVTTLNNLAWFIAG